MRTWPLVVDQLSRERVAELRYFCLQYPQKKAMKDSRSLSDVALIEAAAHEAAGSEALTPYLLKNVTNGIGLSLLRVPMGKGQFYAMRRRFFMILDKMQRA